MKLEKGSVQTTVLVVIIVILVAIVAYMFAKRPATDQTNVSPSPTTSASVSPSPSPVSTTVNYSDDQMSFTYPKILSLSKTQDGVMLKHEVPHQQPAPCDFKGDGGMVSSIVDFNASFKVVPQSIKDYITSSKADWTYISQNPYSDPQWKGYRADTGVEGCGVVTYYLTITPSKTLVIRRPYSDDLQPISADYQKNLALPGIIKPEVAEQYFNQILSTVKVK